MLRHCAGFALGLVAVALLAGCGGQAPGRQETTLQPAWAGLTGKIIFDSDRKGNRDIYVLTLSPTVSTRRVTNHPAWDERPDWSPDGTRFVFASERSGRSQIWLANADGSGVTRLTYSGKPDNFPAWSPDGTKIAFTRWSMEGECICTINVDGTGAKRLTPLDARCTSPAWSPDGSRIAYCGTNAAGNEDIYTILAADGSGKLRLTNDAVADYEPAYSPDGGRITFTSERGVAKGAERSIWIMHSDGSGEMAIGSGETDEESRWAPDGQHVVFQSQTPAMQLFCMKPNGTERLQLTSAAGSQANASWTQ